MNAYWFISSHFLAIYLLIVFVVSPYSVTFAYANNNRAMDKRNICTEIEKMTGRSMRTPRDYDLLAELIFKKTHESISPSTLKRLWGYLDNGIKPRRYTMDVLAKFLGYADYEAYEQRDGAVESNLVMARRLNVEELSAGRKIRLTWQPDRVCIVEHRGEGRFVVVSAINTKLSVGDTFTCHLFIEREPLFLDNLIHNGGTPTAYVAGSDNGVMFEIEDVL